MAKKTVNQLQMKGKRVLMRVDFNVPLDESGKVTNDQRIQKALPTIQAAMKAGGRVILMSHLGRPKGERNAKYSLKPAAERLGELLGVKVQLAPDCIGDEVQQMVAGMQDGQVMMLENLRFHKGEEKNEAEFSRQLAELADVYVNDAFGTSHRKHASMYGVPALLAKGNRAIGYLVEKELKFLGEAMENPQRPFAAILGGAKVSDKIGVIENLMKKVDVLLIGGAMSYTFMRARGESTGKSKVEETKENKDGSKTDVIALARDLLEKLKSAKAQLFLPVDHLCVQEFDPSAPAKVFDKEIPEGWMGVDVGPKTIDLYRQKLAGAKTVVWNGPMGVFEKEPWAEGTKAICQALADLKGATTVIGGGDSAAAVEQFGYEDKVTHISTGGGASLEFLEGRPFDCMDVIDEA
jgi:3-phosphoglycerate kinase